jgi:ComF family protein
LAAFNNRDQSEIDLNASSVNSIKLLAQQVITAGLDLLFPPLCVNCERVGSFLCSRCLSGVKQPPERTVTGFDGIAVRATFEGPIRAAIHALKYEGQTRLAGPLGMLMNENLERADWPVDVVVAVPLHESRLRARGYNQAALLANHVAWMHHWTFAPSALRRIRETASQVDLSAQERRANVEAAFAAEPTVFHGKRVLVIDDVLTTGATLSACADALRAAGATHIYGATVAGAVGLGDR